MPEPLELRERTVTVFDSDGVHQDVTVLEPTLGLTPFVLLYCEEFDPLGAPVFNMRFGGGLELVQLPPLLRSLHDSLIADAALEGIDLTQSTGGTDEQSRD